MWWTTEGHFVAPGGHVPSHALYGRTFETATDRTIAFFYHHVAARCTMSAAQASPAKSFVSCENLSFFLHYFLFFHLSPFFFSRPFFALFFFFLSHVISNEKLFPPSLDVTVAVAVAVSVVFGWRYLVLWCDLRRQLWRARGDRDLVILGCFFFSWACPTHHLPAIRSCCDEILRRRCRQRMEHRRRRRDRSLPSSSAACALRWRRLLYERRMEWKLTCERRSH